jgi:IS5 family transposase
MLCRWFVGLEMDDAVWHRSTFSKYRERLLDNAVLPELFDAVLAMARKRQLISDEHFSIDGTLIDAWASYKSFRACDDDDDKPGGKERDCHGEARSNDTHVRRTDPEAQLMRKTRGMEARLRYGVHHVVENRNHLIVGVTTAPAASVDERKAGMELLAQLPGQHRKAVAGDKGYDTRGFVTGCRTIGITPHVAMNENRRGGTALDTRTTRHPGYAISQRKRKMIETTFGQRIDAATIAGYWAPCTRMVRRSAGRVGHRQISSIFCLSAPPCSSIVLMARHDSHMRTVQ